MPRARNQRRQGQSLSRAVETGHEIIFTNYAPSAGQSASEPVIANMLFFGENGKMRHTVDCGKLLAVALTAEDMAPPAPKPVNDEYKTSVANCSGERISPGPTPSSNIRFIPPYPTRQKIKALMSGIRGPCASTMRPRIGPEMYVPAACYVDRCPSRLGETTHHWQRGPRY